MLNGTSVGRMGAGGQRPELSNESAPDLPRAQVGAKHFALGGAQKRRPKTIKVIQSVEPDGLGLCRV